MEKQFLSWINLGKFITLSKRIREINKERIYLH